MKHGVLVSVIIPTCKRDVFYLSRAVESVLNQTYPDIEILVIDDSTAAYPLRAEIEAYIRTLDGGKVRYYQNEKNLGGSLSRNRGIGLARGQYITFLDDDDEYMPGKVEKQLAFMLKHGYDLTFSDMILYSNAGNVVDYREYGDISGLDRDGLLRYHLTKHLTGTPTFMFKADKLKEIGGFDDANMGQEFYLMLKSIQRGLAVGYLPECDVKVYKHPDGGISSGTNKINGEKALYEEKKRYFPQLNPAERRFVRFRHHAVMAVAYKRNRMWIRMLGEGGVALLASPFDFIREGSKFLGRVYRHRNQK